MTHGSELETRYARSPKEVGRPTAPGYPAVAQIAGQSHLTRSLGTRESSSPDFLSLLMFQRDYLARLIAIGERDAETRRHELVALLGPRPG